MMKKDDPRPVGFVCAYTPLSLINAAGFSHYRILPVGDWPDQAGHLLHDNLCPHVKRILDRALERDLPDLAGMIFTNSCDAMRRAADAWQRIRPDDRVFLIDLPSTADETAIKFLAGEFNRLAQQLHQWGGKTPNPENIQNSVRNYNTIAILLTELRKKLLRKQLKGGRSRLQGIYNHTATQSFKTARENLETALAKPPVEKSNNGLVPIYLFGNVLSDPEVYTLLEACGADIVGDDFCTGTRMFAPIETGPSEEIYLKLAESVLSQPPCARTFNCDQPGKMAVDVLSQAKTCNARGVIGHTLKFCDPYLARLPLVRNVFRKEGIPLLLLEGDCTLRSIGQQRTRIEAFIEMLR